MKFMSNTLDELIFGYIGEIDIGYMLIEINTRIRKNYENLKTRK